MATPRPPIDAKAAKRMLRLHVVAIPLATLVGGWCLLLTFVWITTPMAVEAIPATLKVAASAAAALWLGWLVRTFKKIPGLVDDIIERGLSLDADRHSRARPRLESASRRD